MTTIVTAVATDTRPPIWNVTAAVVELVRADNEASAVAALRNNLIGHGFDVSEEDASAFRSEPVDTVPPLPQPCRRGAAKPSAGFVIAAARNLLTYDDAGPTNPDSEYLRALVELACDLIGYRDDAERDVIAARIHAPSPDA